MPRTLGKPSPRAGLTRPSMLPGTRLVSGLPAFRTCRSSSHRRAHQTVPPTTLGTCHPVAPHPSPDLDIVRARSWGPPNGQTATCQRGLRGHGSWPGVWACRSMKSCRSGNWGRSRYATWTARGVLADAGHPVERSNRNHTAARRGDIAGYLRVIRCVGPAGHRTARCALLARGCIDARSSQQPGRRRVMSRHCVSAPYPCDGLVSRVEPRPSPVGPGLRHARVFAVSAGEPRLRHACGGAGWQPVPLSKALIAFGAAGLPECRCCGCRSSSPAAGKPCRSRRGTPRRPDSRWRRGGLR